MHTGGRQLSDSDSWYEVSVDCVADYGSDFAND